MLDTQPGKRVVTFSDFIEIMGNFLSYSLTDDELHLFVMQIRHYQLTKLKSISEPIHLCLRMIFFFSFQGTNIEVAISSLRIDPVTTEDVKIALERTKPSTAKLRAKYEAWQKQFESV